MKENGGNREKLIFTVRKNCAMTRVNNGRAQFIHLLYCYFSARKRYFTHFSSFF